MCTHPSLTAVADVVQSAVYAAIGEHTEPRATDLDHHRAPPPSQRTASRWSGAAWIESLGLHSLLSDALLAELHAQAGGASAMAEITFIEMIGRLPSETAVHALLSRSQLVEKLASKLWEAAADLGRAEQAATAPGLESERLSNKFVWSDEHGPLHYTPR